METIAWDLTKDKIEFKPMTGSTNESPATFESQNFFNNQTMRKLQGVNDENPLFTLWKAYNAGNFKPLTYEQIVRYFNRPPEDVKSMLIQFAADGFVEYDVNANKIYYRKKIAQYLNNDVNKKDFDNIILESKTHYAVLNLENNDLTVTGCEYFVLSDAQIVNVYPTEERVTVERDRDMRFSGRIIAGLFDFVSHKCDFNYESFNVRMEDIDSLIMYVEDKNGPQNIYGEYRLSKVQSWAGHSTLTCHGTSRAKSTIPSSPTSAVSKADTSITTIQRPSTAITTVANSSMRWTTSPSPT